MRHHLRQFAILLAHWLGIVRLCQFARRKRVVILTIHGVMDDRDQPSWKPLRPQLSRDKLQDYLRALSERYHFISLKEAVDMLLGRKSVRPYSMVLTFDDGYRNNLTHALPILRQYGAPATFFVPTGFLKRPRPFWWDRLDYALQQARVDGRQVTIGSLTVCLDGRNPEALRASYQQLRRTAKQLQMTDQEFLRDVGRLTDQLEAESGRALSAIHMNDDWSAVMTWKDVGESSADNVAFGSHTVDHVRLGLVDAQTAREQLVRSKQEIESHTGKPCQAVCFPNGSFTAEVISLARASGYLCGVTSGEGTNGVGDEVMTLRRIDLPVDASCADLLFRISVTCGQNFIHPATHRKDDGRRSGTMMERRTPSGKCRICFVAHPAFGAMAGGNSGRIGGIERQTSLMARWLASRGHTVSMLTWDEGQEDGLEIDGVRIFKMCRPHAGLPGVRFLSPRWTSLNAALRRADADIYYQNCAECVTGQVAFWCRRSGRRFVFSSAADSHCDVKLPYMHSFRDRSLYRYGLKHADVVIVQTRRQQRMLREGLARDSIILPMPCPGPPGHDLGTPAPEGDGRPRVLWVGRIYELKRLDRLLDVAEVCPEVDFDVVGPLADNEYARRVGERARTLPNVVLHGPIARDGIPVFYRRARVLCCTSESEGFPNTFLEAWSYGLPIVTTFDPDYLIAERGLGVVAADVSGLVKGIRLMVESQESWHQASQAALRQYNENHTVDAAMARFEQVFMDLLCDAGS